LSELLATTEEAKMIKLYIVWGTCPDRVNYVPCEYEFDTREQADAFIYGVSEAQGWDSSTTFNSIQEAQQHIAKANGHCVIREEKAL
jgi:hypothetical protein